MYTCATNFQLVAELLRSTARGLLSFWVFTNGAMLAEGITTSWPRGLPESMPKDAHAAGLSMSDSCKNRRPERIGRRTHLCRYGLGLKSVEPIALLFVVLVGNSRVIGHPGQEYVTYNFNEPIEVDNLVNIPLPQHSLDPSMQRNGALLSNTSTQFLQKSTWHGGSFDRKLQGPMQKEIEFVLTKLNGDFQATKLHSAILILFSIPFAIATVLC